MDANITSLIAAGVLFFFGTSSVKGFATTLIISLLMSIITNVYGTRFFLGLWVNSNVFNKRPSWFGVRKKDIHDLSEQKELYTLPTRFDKIDFMKTRKIFYGISIGITILGILFLFVFKLNLGIDFTSGTRVEVTANESLTKEKVAAEFDKLNLASDDIVLAGENSQTGVVQLKGVLSQQQIADLKTHFTDLYGAEPNVSTVSPTIGKELAKNAIYAVLIASIGIILYVSVRFEWRMGVPTVIALFHDAFFIITVFSLLRLEVDITFIAAILTIIGYSINDTIVTFDRVRENLLYKKKIKTLEELEEIANISIRQTLTRSLNTVLTVTVAIIALMIFGSEAIRNFSIALFIGMICGVYSSVFIAIQLWVDFKNKELKKKGTLNTEKEKRESLEGQV
jgi:preprotein translocase SecF subunit